MYVNTAFPYYISVTLNVLVQILLLTRTTCVKTCHVVLVFVAPTVHMSVSDFFLCVLQYVSWYLWGFRATPALVLSVVDH